MHKFRFIRFYVLSLMLIVTLLFACGLDKKNVEFSGSIEAGVSFMRNQYNPEVGLIRESPDTAPNRYWLMSDNWLAVQALRAADEHQLAGKVQTAIAEYRTSLDNMEHGAIEVLIGRDISWPPSTPEQRQLSERVWVETRDTNETMNDWRKYSDLALYGALDAWNEGDYETARGRYRIALQCFDGVGFRDKAFDDHYATYKVALALYVGCTIGVKPSPAFIDILLSMQDSDGGFTAMYDSRGKRVGDANTETTSLVVLALSNYSCN